MEWFILLGALTMAYAGGTLTGIAIGQRNAHKKAQRRYFEGLRKGFFTAKTMYKKDAS